MAHINLKSGRGLKDHVVLLKLWSVLPQRLICFKEPLLMEAPGESAPVFQVKLWLLKQLEP